MPNSELAEKILTENAALRTELATLGAKLDGLEDRGRHTRWLTYLLSAGLAAVLLVWGYTNLNDRVDTLQQYQVANCQSGNDLRAQDRAFWGDILAVIAPADGGPRAKAFAGKIQGKVDARYAPRDCTVVAQGRVK